MTNSDFATQRYRVEGFRPRPCNSGSGREPLFGLEMGRDQNVRRATSRGQVWVPAAAVIPTLLVYFNVAAFKTFVVYGALFFAQRVRGDRKINCSLFGETRRRFPSAWRERAFCRKAYLTETRFRGFMPASRPTKSLQFVAARAVAPPRDGAVPDKKPIAQEEWFIFFFFDCWFLLGIRDVSAPAFAGGRRQGKREWTRQVSLYC